MERSLAYISRLIKPFGIPSKAKKKEEKEEEAPVQAVIPGGSPGKAAKKEQPEKDDMEDDEFGGAAKVEEVLPADLLQSHSVLGVDDFESAEITFKDGDWQEQVIHEGVYYQVFGWGGQEDDKYDDEDGAFKYSALLIKSISHFLAKQPYRKGVHFPLVCMHSVWGTRVVAISELPEASPMTGSLFLRKLQGIVDEIVEEVCIDCGLKVHQVTINDEKRRVAGSIDLMSVVAVDGRIYCLNLGTCFPPTPPMPWCSMLTQRVANAMQEQAQLYDV